MCETDGQFHDKIGLIYKLNSEAMAHSRCLIAWSIFDKVAKLRTMNSTFEVCDDKKNFTGYSFLFPV